MSRARLSKTQRQWKTAVTACRMQGLLCRLSWQSLLAAFAHAPELDYLVNGVKKKYGMEPDHPAGETLSQGS